VTIPKQKEKQDRKCNIEARSCNPWCSRKTISIIYILCVCLQP